MNWSIAREFPIKTYFKLYYTQKKKQYLSAIREVEFVYLIVKDEVHINSYSIFKGFIGRITFANYVKIHLVSFMVTFLLTKQQSTFQILLFSTETGPFYSLSVLFLSHKMFLYHHTTK